MISTKKRKVFSIEEKSIIVQRLLDGELNINIAKEFGVTHSTVSTIWKDREKILKFSETKSTKIKRARTSGHKDIEDALVSWLKEQRAANEPINGAIIKKKAKDLAEELEKTDFKITSSWIQRFRNRHNLSGPRVPRKRLMPSANLEEECLPQDCLTQEWLTQDRLSDEWLAMCEGYSPDDIFNADETGLFFNITPDKIDKFKFEQYLDGSKPDRRITLLVAANMTGTCKENLLLVGSKKLSFQNFRSLHVIYETNNKSWMTTQIFDKWIRNWDNRLRLKRRSIVLIIDKSPVHPVIRNLRYIKIVYLPENIPSVLQPMGQGIITALKAQYRKLQVLNMLQKLNRGGHKDFSLFDAILTISEAWENISQKTIADCFQFAGFKDLSVISTPSQNVNEKNTPSEKTSDRSGVNCENLVLTRLVQALGSTFTMTQIEEFIEVDKNITVCPTPGAKDKEYPTKNKDKLNTVENSCNQENVTLPSLNDALIAVQVLQNFLKFNEEFKNDSNQEVLTQIRSQVQNAYINQQCYKVSCTPANSTKTTL